MKRERGVTAESIDSVADYMRAIGAGQRAAALRLFRGQCNVGWPLVPSIARQCASPDVEARMLDEFTRRALPHLDPAPNLDPCDWLALAQQHGMHTRLLDWSGNALAALWFAVRNANGTGDDGVVWCLSHDADDIATAAERRAPLEVTRTKVFRPRHVMPRITAQDGWFTIHRYDTGARRFTPLDEDPDLAGRLTRIVVPGARFGAIRRELAGVGVSVGTIFPDLDGIAQLTVSRFFPDDEDTHAPQ
ncbi:FRG domain-containing protein [Burkholderia sp. Nafp2/4-1b]|uniref:FRG domain-containing protein n=1 Tax=Burkholderia sp. Nafp2/4-1b TaxID=2116686 RepID=UPI000EF8F15E|nr:FRG domain-containing protein [Burkholderia sp. Nafp2/4-1b]RKU00149.1 FRG domain-containing protein [Burkholderia sp. Nafp2/4-1b]